MFSPYSFLNWGKAMSKEVIVEKLPTCDFCGKVACYDFKTKMGPWANACKEHYLSNRMYDTLGTGKGQKLEASE